MFQFASKKLYMVWATTCIVAAGVVYFSLEFRDPGGTVLQVFGSSIRLGFDAREMAAETIGRLLHTLVPGVIVCSGFSGLVDSQGAQPQNTGLRVYLIRLLAAIAQGFLLSLLTALPLMALMIRLARDGAGIQDSLAWFYFGASGALMGLQLLLWSGTLLWLVRSNPWLAVLGAFSASYAGRLCGWVNEWGPDLGLSSIVLKLSSTLAACLPQEFIPNENLEWRQMILAAAIPLCFNVVLRAIGGRADRRLS